LNNIIFVACLQLLATASKLWIVCFFVLHFINCLYLKIKVANHGLKFQLIVAFNRLYSQSYVWK